MSDTDPDPAPGPVMENSMIDPEVWSELLTLVNFQIDKRYFELQYQPHRGDWMVAVTFQGMLLCRHSADINRALEAICERIYQIRERSQFPPNGVTPLDQDPP